MQALLALAQQSTGALEPAAPYIFFALAALTCLSAWAIVISQNIVRMAIYLLLTLGGVAGLYFMLNAELLAAIQLIVYVGGTLILIIFGVMLTSRNPFLQLKAKGWEIALGVAISVAIAGLLVLAKENSSLKDHSEYAGVVGLGAKDYAQVHAVGRGLLSTYLVPFEVAGVLLLVVMIGAAFMARKRMD